VNLNERLSRVERAMFPRLRRRARPFVGSPGAPVQLRPDAGEEARRLVETIRGMDASIPDGLLE